MVNRVGQQLGNYRLVRLLGVGGYAEVYLAEHLYLQTNAAIKVLNSSLTDPNDTQQFTEEARTIAHLQHPNILRVLDFGIEAHIPFLVMVYAPNGTIRLSHPRGTQVPLVDVLSYVNQVASALQYAHDQKLIHRDVKPENMLLGSRNEVLLSDFGIAQAVHSTHSMHTSQGMIGTVNYMAPEQIDGKPRPASDQYALGIVTYEWLCGRLPFKGGSLVERVMQHMMARPQPLCEVVPSLPVSVDQVVMKALAKDPKERFERIEDFAKALEVAAEPTTPLGNRSVLSSPTTTDLPLSSPSSSLIDVSMWTNVAESEHPIPTVQQPQQVDQLTLRFHPATPAIDPQPSKVESPLSPTKPPLISKLSQTFYQRFTLLAHRLHVAIVPSQAAPGYVKTFSLGSLIATCHGHTDWVRAVTWSPDGNYLATVSNDTTIQIWNALTGRRASLYRGHTDVIHSVNWAPEGKYLVTAAADRTVALWVSSTGQKKFSYSGHSGEVYAAVWSPDSKRLVSAGADRIVHVWDAVNHKKLLLYKGHTDWVRAVAWSPNGKYIATAGNDKTVQIWNAITGYSYRTYNSHTDWVRAIAWSPDGTRIASAGNDKTVQIWDVATGHQEFLYLGHTECWLGGVLAVAWSPTGNYVASAGEDQTVQIWEPFTGKEVFTYRRHVAPVNAIAWSPDGKYVATASNDKTVHVWWCS